MTVTAPYIRSAAALVAAVPGVAVHLTLPDQTVIAGDSDDATMCGHTFRSLVIDQFLDGSGLDHATLTIPNADHITGLISNGRTGKAAARWFVSPLPAPMTVETLREAGHTKAPLQALVRADADLGVSVVAVRDQSGASTPTELDDAAVAASAACVVAHLLATAGLSSSPTGTTHPNR